MKVSITIQDLEVTEAEKILSQLGGTPRTIGQVIRDIPHEENKVNVPFTPPAGAGSPEIPSHFNVPESQQQPPAQNDDEGGESAGDVTGQVDARGLPWDARIHSGNKKMTDKGVWQKRRGAQQAEIDAVEAELRGAASQQAPAAPQATHQPFTPPVGQSPAFVPPQAQAPQQPAAPAPAPAPAPAAPAAPAQPVATRDFQGLMNTISSLFATGAINPDYLNSVVARIADGYKVQLNAITDITAQPHMVEYAFQLLQADGKIA